MVFENGGESKVDVQSEEPKKMPVGGVPGSRTLRKNGYIGPVNTDAYGGGWQVCG